MRKRILSAVLAGTLAATVLAGSVISAGAIKKDDDSYDPGSVESNTYLFAMPGGWESDYWKTNENRAGIYWWTGADVPKDQEETAVCRAGRDKTEASGYSRRHPCNRADFGRPAASADKRTT